jgi:predicted ester cyclase
MRRSLTIAALIFGASTGAATADPAEVVTSFYEGLNSGDPAVFDVALADGWVVHGTSPSLPTLDFDSYLQSLSTISAGLSDSNYDVDAVIVAGDLVTVRGTITGVHTGPLFGVPATGNEVEFGAIDVHRVENNEIVESWHVEDFTTLLGQIGGLPAQAEQAD